ncbi:glycosyltransferase, partial [Nocardioides sp.]|uniref:glycosyltransferase n=1 Tax=Nocardioides sp. TaxID=35761 RepID=UPI0027323415
MTVDVTVVVPVYNTLPYLTSCLDSLVGQTIGHERMQVVAVDDGSTDGSGAELDRYAAAHPQLFTVIHQENSGGPARPCNVGLDAATGRFVFFLGADDRLGVEALDRMVTKADEWGSDVLCARLVGTDGRWVNQRLFRQTDPDVPFPSRILASGLSNTKLFRRSVLEEHGIRYPEGLRIGSDQPFTIEAMLHAQRVSVLADYEYYYAVRREDAQNLTYSSPWRTRLADMTTIVAHIARLLGPGEGRDQILARHLSGELARLLRVDFGALPAEEQAELVAGVAAVAEEHLTPAIEAELKVLARLRYVLARQGRLDDLRALVGAEDRPIPLRFDGDDVLIEVPGLVDELPRAMFVGTHEPLRSQLAAAIGEVHLSWDGPRLRLRATTLLTGDVVARVTLGKLVEGASRDARQYSRADAGSTVWPMQPASLDADGVLEAELDLGGLLADHDVHA